MKMKKIWIFAVLLFLSSQLKAQEKNQLNEMIASTINSYIKNDSIFWAEEKAINKNATNSYYLYKDSCYYYLCIDELPDAFPFSSVGKVALFSLHNIEGYPNSFKKILNKGIRAIFVKIRLSNNELTVRVDVCYVQRTKKRHIKISYGEGDDCVHTYKYSCDNQNWNLVNAKQEGI